VAKSYMSSFVAKAYLKVYPRVRPYLGTNKRKSGVRFKVIDDDLYLAIDAASSCQIFFYATSRARLYYRPDGILGRVSDLYRKYSDKEIQVERGDVVVDIGANVGEFSLSACKAEKIYAFEPDPIAFRCLRQNLISLPHECLQIALSDANRHAEFFLASSSADSSTIEPEKYDRKVTISVRTLDDVCEEKSLNRIDFLKVEAEGAEPEVLRGAKRILNSVCKVAVDVSAERRGESTWKEVKEILERSGFNVWSRGNVAFGSRKAKND